MSLIAPRRVFGLRLGSVSRNTRAACARSAYLDRARSWPLFNRRYTMKRRSIAMCSFLCQISRHGCAWYTFCGFSAGMAAGGSGCSYRAAAGVCLYGADLLFHDCRDLVGHGLDLVLIVYWSIGYKICYIYNTYNIITYYAVCYSKLNLIYRALLFIPSTCNVIFFSIYSDAVVSQVIFKILWSTCSDAYYCLE